ncbi:MAG: hypothetical protein J6I35_09570 [Ruminobacter sp.]|uniref:hypothetical protein n=1 Tax=Ruminobacter sp. TaxID=2774296 RepID=UPI001B5434BC|nr:hypothetical protein [Ruminobacter sp.]MBP3749771.1 hypothetical protein [Ruminobacter sp.]
MINKQFLERGYELTAKYGVVTDTDPLSGKKAEEDYFYYHVPESLLDTLLPFIRKHLNISSFR